MTEETKPFFYAKQEGATVCRMCYQNVEVGCDCYDEEIDDYIFYKDAAILKAIADS